MRPVWVKRAKPAPKPRKRRRRWKISVPWSSVQVWALIRALTFVERSMKFCLERSSFGSMF